jgi:hypothetical protein
LDAIAVRNHYPSASLPWCVSVGVTAPRSDHLDRHQCRDQDSEPDSNGEAKRSRIGNCKNNESSQVQPYDLVPRRILVLPSFARLCHMRTLGHSGSHTFGF